LNIIPHIDKKTPIPFLLKVILGILVLILFSVWCWRAFTLLSFPFPIDYSEASLLQGSILWKSTGTLYSPLEIMPMVHIAYPPLFMFVLQIFEEPQNMLFAGRILSVLSALICAWVIFLSGPKNNKLFAVGLITLWLSLPEVYRLNGMLRPDLPGLACLAIAFYSYRQNKKWICVCFLCLAILFKHMFIVLALIYLIIEWYKKSKSLKLFMLPILILIGFMFGECGKHLFYYHSLDFDWSRFSPLIYQILKDSFMILCIVLLSGTQFKKFIFLWAGLSFIFISFLINKPGSEALYGLEFQLALILGLRSLEIKTEHLKIIFILLIAGLLINLPLPNTKVSSRMYANTSAPASAKGSTPDIQDFENGAALLNLLKSTRGRVLSENPAWPLLAGHQPELSPFQVNQLTQINKLSEEKILTDISQHNFSLIMSEGQLDENQNRYFSEAIRRKILDHYSLNQAFGQQHLYIPNQ